MTNNGKKNRLVLRVEINQEGQMVVEFGCGMAVRSHAIRLASLELDNIIIGSQVEEKSDVVLPDRFVT